MDTKSIKVKAHHACQEKISNVDGQSKDEKISKNREDEVIGKSMDELLQETNEIAMKVVNVSADEDLESRKEKVQQWESRSKKALREVEKRGTSKAAKDEVLTIDDERDQRKTKEKDVNFG